MSADTSSRAGRRALPVVLAAVLLLGVVLVLGPTGTGLPLAPDAAGDAGLLGLVRTLEQLDVEVTVSTRPPGSTDVRAFLPLDTLPERRRDAWRDWVDAGGTLVLADPSSRLHDREVVAPAFGDLLAAVEQPPGCDLVPSDVRLIRHDGWTGYEPRGAPTCFDLEDDAAWYVEVAQGQGRLVLLGSAAPFTNRWLGEADNAVLATSLLGPEGGAQLTFVPRPDPDDADVTLFDLVPDQVWRLLALLGLAVVVGVIAYGRRLGLPVTERLPPVVPSATLAASVADLTRRAGDRQGAADRLRRRARQEVARALGAAPDAAPDLLASRVAATLHLDLEVARTALVDRPVADDDALVDVAAGAAHVLTALAAPSVVDATPPRAPS